eukprot:CAMPEP_0202692308 /NCGR_PEP_ID=MMETSP1385-20130828/6722_1 /ASSEMBLY_ACC=CAM_ASM_000861 /TAXON_ID=933848 /ORGANISM="Elphidium margaritaceum" /LENGTH=501 /DNA_ID=CAMNT_0049347817 /DNA_START=25 /DNA_END=1530 /DNA_ORIENTATION=-
MIHTEQLIKRKINGHAEYDADSDEEIQKMRYKKGNGQNHGRRRKKNRHLDPKFYENDSDFEPPEEAEEKMDNKNKELDVKKLRVPANQASFDKVDVEPIGLHRQASALSAIISTMPIQPEIMDGRGGQYYGGRQHSKVASNGANMSMHSTHVHDTLEMNGSKFSRYEPESEHGGNNGPFHSFILKVYFGEHIHEEPMKMEITSAWTVAETMEHAIQKWRMERAMLKLQGTSSANYSMRCMDDDEIDQDVPAFSKHLQIHTLGEKVVGLQYVGGDDTGGVMDFKNLAKPQLLIRISIPGPNNESHVLAIDKDATALTLRDLISLLNKKKHSIHFHAQYFNFYFEGQTKAKDALNLGKAIIDLEANRQLVLLPKFLSQNDDINEAYSLTLVRLANERREYHSSKVRSARKNKKRLLVVDRYRIVKKGLDESIVGGNDHVPIDIISITDLKVNDKNTKQFIIEYRKPQNTATTTQVYELDNQQECQHFVQKVKYLITLRKLQGI